MSHHCMLCPRQCGADRGHGQIGFCGAGKALRVARAALHMWEEPPVSGTHGSGTVFFSHCPLKCVYCQNREISAGGSGLDISETRLVQIFFELRDMGAHNINLVSPTQYAAQVAGAIRIARGQGFDLPFVWNTGGYERVETLRMLRGLIDVYLTDFKYMSAKRAMRYSGAPDYPPVAEAALCEMLLQRPECKYQGGLFAPRGYRPSFGFARLYGGFKSCAGPRVRALRPSGDSVGHAPVHAACRLCGAGAFAGADRCGI